MGLYSKWILPRLLHTAMSQRNLLPYRQRLTAMAEGRVLEIGIGSGLNLPFYTDKVERVIGVEPSRELLAMARKAADTAAYPVELLPASAEAIALDDCSVDTVVTAWTLCTVPHAEAALREMRRVLTPNGKLLFVEHGSAPDPGVREWQDRLTPLWKCIAGGCHLNRNPQEQLRSAGFSIDQLATGYIPGPRPFTFMYEGQARK
ncbi:class I SAM-dependent methyltransferase [Thalassobaculum sp.]|uniref:class I SAM-dependent methyltransferase n=1 Tax=Thalassobaculum sp. TaxID=2022740 RepID=UPI0032EC75E9